MPHSNPLINLLVDNDKAEELKQQSEHFPSITLTKRQLCDLEMLINGGMSPLTGYMDKKTYDSVIQTTRLPDKQLWPIPIVLDIDAKTAAKLSSGASVFPF
ncbi:MAG: hypothetical protein KZQ57_11555 [gamma proteobacterium symbiont of Lucinoma myriamae]|nr:hypothetical protein [gamma proteobacterium symbiont of Lucinoma myriamae]